MLDLRSYLGLLSWCAYFAGVCYFCRIVAVRAMPRHAYAAQARALLLLFLVFALQALVVFYLGLLHLLYLPTFLLLGGLGALGGYLLRPRPAPPPAADDARLLAFVRVLPPALVLPLLVLFAGYLTFSLVPTQEYDSIVDLLPQIVGWAQQHAVPAVYAGASPYTKSWEFQYLPGIVCCGRDLLTWLPGFLALGALSLASLLLARALGLSTRVGVALQLGMLGYATLLYGWISNSGIASIKNDIISGVSYAVALLCLLTFRRRPAGALFGDVLLFTCALTMLVGTKTSGAVLACLIAPVWLVIGWRRRADMPPARRPVFLLLPIAAAVVSVLPFYLTQILTHGSPFWPVQIAVGSRVVFPGLLNYAGTRLIDHLGDAGFWPFFWQRHAGFAGQDFQATLVVALLSLGLLLFSHPAVRRRAARWSRLFAELPRVDLGLVWLFTALGWLLYLQLPLGYSATTGGPPIYVGFVRYAFGALLLSNLLGAVVLAVLWQRLAALLPRTGLRVLHGLGWGGLFVLLLLRGSLLTGQMPVLGRMQPTFLLVYLTVFALLLACWLRARVTRRPPVTGRAAKPAPRPRAWMPALPAVAGVALALLVPTLREAMRREFWFPEIKPIWTTIWRESDIPLRIGKNEFGAYYLVLWGPRFTNVIVNVPAASEQPATPFTGGDHFVTPPTDDLDFIFLHSNPTCNMLPDIQALARELDTRNWMSAAMGQNAMLYMSPSREYHGGVW